MIVHIDSSFAESELRQKLSDECSLIMRHGHFICCDGKTRRLICNAINECGSRSQRDMMHIYKGFDITQECHRYLTTIDIAAYANNLHQLIELPSEIQVENGPYEWDLYKSLPEIYKHDAQYKNMYAMLAKAMKNNKIVPSHGGGFGSYRALMQQKDSDTYKDVYRLKSCEVQIENCSLDEAGTVFSRINSKGTAISKVSMLQAIYYKDEHTPLLSDEINDLVNSLAIYGFEGLNENDVLNCCCRYIGKNFYDSKIMEDLVKNDLTKYFPSIRADITKAIKFLHDDCCVLSHKMLPYAKQLVGITNFFKETKNPTNEQLQELKKWFFYTTVCQSFQNSSLTAVRALYRNLDKFIQGKSEKAMEKYSAIKLPSLDFRFSTSSALSNFLMITLAKVYKNYAPKDVTLAYMGQGKILGESSAGVFLYLTVHDKKVMTQLINACDVDAVDLERHALTMDMVNLLRQGDKERFRIEREKLLAKYETCLLQELGIKIENDICANL